MYRKSLSKKDIQELFKRSGASDRARRSSKRSSHEPDPENHSVLSRTGRPSSFILSYLIKLGYGIEMSARVSQTSIKLMSDAHAVAALWGRVTMTAILIDEAIIMLLSSYPIAMQRMAAVCWYGGGTAKTTEYGSCGFRLTGPIGYEVYIFFLVWRLILRISIRVFRCLRLIRITRNRQIYCD